MHKFVLKVSSNARRDLSSIWQYTFVEWGKEQAEKYLHEIEQAFTKLLDFPELGKKRPELLPDCHSLPVGQHIIFYCPSGNVVNILRVLHQQVDIPNHLTRVAEVSFNNLKNLDGVAGSKKQAATQKSS